MSQSQHPGYYRPAVGEADSDVRGPFLTRTYNHLFGAIVLFTLLEVALFASGAAELVVRAFSGRWMLVMLAFMGVSWIATRAAHVAESLAAQYAALAGYVVAEALVFVPMLYIANRVAPGTIQSAGILTMVGFAGLTGIVFWTRADFSFMRAILMWGMVISLVAILGSLLFGFQLGTLFSVAMIALAGGAILYDTSNVLHHYPEDRYVAASLQLFASVALMFWYVLRLLSSRR